MSLNSICELLVDKNPTYFSSNILAIYGLQVIVFIPFNIMKCFRDVITFISLSSSDENFRPSLFSIYLILLTSYVSGNLKSKYSSFTSRGVLGAFWLSVCIPFFSSSPSIPSNSKSLYCNTPDAGHL